MIQQLFREIEHLKAEIRRLRGELQRLAIGGKIIPAAQQGSASVPTGLLGALIRGTSTGWERLAASAPAAGLRNVLGMDNGDTTPSWKAALDTTNPSTITPGDAGSPGTSLIFAHRDHDHPFDPNVEDFGTAETDVTLVLHPDGVGGIEWGADMGSGGGGGGGGGTDIALPYNLEWTDLIATHPGLPDETSAARIRIYIRIPSNWDGVSDVVVKTAWQATSTGLADLEDSIFQNPDSDESSQATIQAFANNNLTWAVAGTFKTITTILPAASIVADDWYAFSYRRGTGDANTGGLQFEGASVRTGLIGGSGVGNTSIWMPDAPPATAGADDDEFADASGGVPGGWTEVDHGTSLTVTEDEAGLKLAATTGAGWAGIYKPIPAGDFTIWTKVSISGIGMVNFLAAGLVLWENAAISTGDLRPFLIESNATAARVAVQAWTDYGTFSSSLVLLDMSVDVMPSSIYLRIRRNGTTYLFEMSTDGIGWLRIYSTAALGFVPTHYGPALNTYDFASVNHSVRFPFFRYKNSDITVNGLAEGDRVAMGGHVIQDDNVDMTNRSRLSFQDGFTVTDDSAGDQTEIDLASHDNTFHANRTRYVSLPLARENWAAPVNDSHGSFTNVHLHFDLANAATTVLASLPVIMPADYVPGTTVALKIRYLSTVNTGDWLYGSQVNEYTSGDNSVTALQDTQTVVTVPGTANQMAEVSRNLTVNPTAGKSINVRIFRLGADAGDTTTGVIAIFSAWLEYTADM